jgi:hypothetical protein
MAGLEAWEIGLLVVAAYLALATLVRLMARRRDKLLDDLSRGAEQHRRKAASVGQAFQPDKKRESS